MTYFANHPTAPPPLDEQISEAAMEPVDLSLATYQRWYRDSHPVAARRTRCPRCYGLNGHHASDCPEG